MRLSQHQTGSMLLSVLFLILLLSVFMAGMVMLSSQSSQQLVYEVQSLKARLAAESILEKQVYASLEDITAVAVYSEEEPYEDNAGCSAYIYRFVDPENNDNTENNQRVNIIARGECSSSQLTVIRNIEVEVLDESL